MPLPNIGSMDRDTGRSEGATAVKAVPFPCAVLDPKTARPLNCTFASPDQGLVARLDPSLLPQTSGSLLLIGYPLTLIG
jgi:hypothetical protein